MTLLAALHGLLTAVFTREEPPTITDVTFEAGLGGSAEMVRFSFSNGRRIWEPLFLYPRLQKATHAQRDYWHRADEGLTIVWPRLSTRISGESLLRLRPF